MTVLCCRQFCAADSFVLTTVLCCRQFCLPNICLPASLNFVFLWMLFKVGARAEVRKTRRWNEYPTCWTCALGTRDWRKTTIFNIFVFTAVFLKKQPFIHKCIVGIYKVRNIKPKLSNCNLFIQNVGYWISTRWKIRQGKGPKVERAADILNVIRWACRAGDYVHHFIV